MQTRPDALRGRYEAQVCHAPSVGHAVYGVRILLVRRSRNAAIVAPIRNALRRSAGWQVGGVRKTKSAGHRPG